MGVAIARFVRLAASILVGIAPATRPLAVAGISLLGASLDASAEQTGSPPGNVVGPIPKRPVKYEVVADTIGCRRTTDFQAAADALHQLDAQWFTENPNCRIFKKGTIAYLLADGFPLAKFCFGPESKCVPLWARATTLEPAYVPPKALTQGALKVCRDDPADASGHGPAEDYPNEIRLPAGLTFIDSGTLDDTGAEPIKVTVITAKAVVIKRGSNCTIVPAKIVDDDSGRPNQPVEHSLTAAQRRVLTAEMVDGRVPQNLPVLFASCAPKSSVCSRAISTLRGRHAREPTISILERKPLRQRADPIRLTAYALEIRSIAAALDLGTR